MTEGDKLDNPLPEPVQGRQGPPEFAVDAADTEEVGAFDALNYGETPADASAVPPKTSAEDDFDFPVADDDDFDLK